jgi:hypothetical protein
VQTPPPATATDAEKTVRTNSDRVAQGGKGVYGASVGILMLQTHFPRIPGDMGNATTWPFPVHYKIVRGATPEQVVLKGSPGLLDVFLEAAAELVAMGADGLTTNCGFLSLFQEEIAAHCGVPVATSSMMQVPSVQALLPPGKRVGILTVSANTLTEAHLKAARVPLDTPIEGTDGGREFTRVLMQNEMTHECAAAEQDILEAGDRLMAKAPDIGAIVLECTNMVPYARALRARLGVPVFDIYSFVTWFQASLQPRDFGPPGSPPSAIPAM